MDAFLNCKVCATDGWTNVDEEQMVHCKICKTEYPINAKEVTSFRN